MLIKRVTQWEFFLDTLDAKKKSAERIERRILRGATNNLQRRNALYRKRLQYKITDAEMTFGYLMAQAEIPFVFQKGFFWPFHRIVDFYVPKIKVAFEIDGGYHLAIADKDRRKDEWFEKERGIVTVRFENSLVMQAPKDCLQLLNDVRAKHFP